MQNDSASLLVTFTKKSIKDQMSFRRLVTSFYKFIKRRSVKQILQRLQATRYTMASNTSAISFCFYISLLFFILCPNVFSHSNSAGCQFNEDIKLDYQRSICPIPSNYSLFNDQFPSGIYKCTAQQWLICMEAGTPLDQGIRVSTFGKFVQLNYALNSRTCRTW